MAYIRGKRYEMEKTAGHGASSVHQNDGQKQAAKRLAAEFKVGPATIERDAKFAAAVDVITVGTGLNLGIKMMPRKPLAGSLTLKKPDARSLDQTFWELFPEGLALPFPPAGDAG